MHPRTFRCPCGTAVVTTAPPVVDELALCLRCARVARLDPLRPLTTGRTAQDAPVRVLAAG